MVKLKPFQLKTKVLRTTILNLQYPNDGAILVHAKENLQTAPDLLAEAY